MSKTTPNSTEHVLSEAEIRVLSTNCLEARNRAYCPYSHFRVGASILTKDGRIIVGANVENASYPVTTCAERVALCTAVTNHGLKRGEVKAIGVATDLDEPASPCGMCRQAIREFSDLSTPIFMYGRSGNYVVKKLEEPPPSALPVYTGDH